MNDKITLSPLFKITCFILIAVGLISFAYGFINSPQQTWANYLLNNYYFLSLAIGASFFYALQYITQSGWSAAFRRVPESFFSYLPIAGVLFLILYFGVEHLYHWAHNGAASHDALIAHKKPYLNIPFFMARIAIFFGLWVFLTYLLRKNSISEDTEGGMKRFKKLEHLSRILIFIIAITFSLGAIDWTMSIDVHWYSALFALKNFIAAFYHGSSIVFLIIILLSYNGKFQFLNKYHIHDFTRYIFMLAILYGYFWFSQYMIIWAGNIPEETTYYVQRLQTNWKPLFFADIIINWAVPFFILLPPIFSRNKALLIVIIALLIVGQWIDLYLQIMPGVLQNNKFGFIEIGTFLGFTGLFAFVIGTSLSKVNLIPQSHPYLEESLRHKF